MKKKSYLSLILLQLLFLSAVAQESKKFTKDILPISPEKTMEKLSIKNPNATDVMVGTVKIEKRVAKYFFESDIAEMTEIKAKRTNFIYLKSFELLNKDNLSSDCINKVNNNFDTSNYNHLRNKDARKKINIVFEGCELEISLYSWDEIDNATSK